MTQSILTATPAMSYGRFFLSDLGVKDYWTLSYDNVGGADPYDLHDYRLLISVQPGIDGTTGTFTYILCECVGNGNLIELITAEDIVSRFPDGEAWMRLHTINDTIRAQTPIEVELMQALIDYFLSLRD